MTLPTRRETATTPTVRVRGAAEPPGTLVLGRYRLHKPLGAGGFATVWIAYDERLEREVAVKILPRARVIGGRFDREARAAARLNHPGIVTLYEAAVDDDAAYLVSELVRGATLDELLEAGRLSDRDIVAIGIALCDALGHAHGQGVVHRDVKPSNVLIPEHPSSPAGLAKLTDFGVARVIGGQALTRTGEIVGTAAYMAPEQAEGREADAAADLYSLALVLYEALTGVNPIAGLTIAGRARRLGAHLPPVRRHRRDLPPELGRAIDLPLRPRPRERGSVAELRGGLARTVEEVEDEPGVVDPPWAAAPPRPVDPTWPEPPPHPEPLPHPAPSPWPAAPRPGAVPAGPHEAVDGRPDFHWPERMLGGAGAAAIAAWLLATAFSPPPLAPAAGAALAAALVVALPRLGWLMLALGLAGALAAAGLPGGALVVLIGLLLPILLLPWTPTRWPLPAAAPALGLVMLAGAWPALAGRDRGVWRRAVLGALGWIWLTVAGLIAGRGAYTRLPPGIPAKSQWMASFDQTVGHAIWPLLHSGVLAPAIVWAVAAAVLPWISRGSAPVRLVLITLWSAALASATTTMLTALHANVAPRAGAVALGAVAGGIVALFPTVLRARRELSGSSDTAAGLA